MKLRLATNIESAEFREAAKDWMDSTDSLWNGGQAASAVTEYIANERGITRYEFRVKQ